MNVGLWGARADNSGLGVQSWEFYRHMQPAKTMAVDISNMTGKENDWSRYNPDDTMRVLGFPKTRDIEAFLEGVDVLFSLETPYNYDVYDMARAKGIKTVLQYNFEFLDYLKKPNLPRPDELWAPSDWELPRAEALGIPLRRVPVPVNTKAVQRHQVAAARTFVHVAGHETTMDRNGTQDVIQAIMATDVDAHFIIYSQHDIPMLQMLANDDRVTVRRHNFEWYWELYDEGDVLLLPRRYGGLTLQMQEAMAAGMLPVMTDVSPNNAILPPELLVPTVNSQKLMTRTEIDCHFIDPQALAKKITDLYNGVYGVAELSQKCYDYACSISWDKVRPQYQALLKP